jgi:glucose/arabinose dehydrogenase
VAFYRAPMRRALFPLLVVAVGTLAACGDDSGPKTLPSSSTTRAPVGTGDSTTTEPAPSSTIAGTTTTAPPDLAAARVALDRWVDGLERPVDLVARPNDERMYVAEQHTGTVRAIAPDGTVSAPILDIGDQLSTGNEQGLLGIEFSADGTLLYVDYTDTEGDTHVVEYTMVGDAADAASRRELLLVDQPYPNHNGGDLARGPDDLLYVSLGDGGAGGDPEGNAQNLSNHLGTILRIDPRPQGDAAYTVPSDNPFVDDEAALPEIWQYGLRNPWRFSFDRATGDLWIGDVGQNEWEEIDTLAAGTGGANFGWDLREGTHEYEGDAPPDAIEPVFEGSHGDGWVSITGGYVYRGSEIPDLVGAYVFADLGQPDLWALAADDPSVTRELGVEVSTVVGFAEDAAGELYVISLDGHIDRVVAA